MNIFSNLHPFFVHFPIALFTTAFVFEIIGLTTKKEIFNKLALYLIVSSIIGVFFAVLTGNNLGDKSTDPAFRSICDIHKESSSLAAYLMVALLIVKLIMLKFKKYEQAIKYISIGIFICATFAVLRAGYFGEKIVYEHAIELQKAQNPIIAPEIRK